MDSIGSLLAGKRIQTSNKNWSQGTGFIQPNVGRATLSLSAESKRTSFFWRQKNKGVFLLSFLGAWRLCYINSFKLWRKEKHLFPHNLEKFQLFWSAQVTVFSDHSWRLRRSSTNFLSKHAMIPPRPFGTYFTKRKNH